MEFNLKSTVRTALATRLHKHINSMLLRLLLYFNMESSTNTIYELHYVIIVTEIKNLM